MPLPSSSLRAPGVLAQLRGDIASRRPVDPGLAGGLRAWLDDGLAVAEHSTAAALPPDPALPGGAPDDGADPVTLPRARAAMVGSLFRQVVTTGAVDDPVRDAIAALRVTARADEILAFLRALATPERTALFDEVETQAAILTARWEAVPAHWFPRTRELLVCPLAGGRLVLRAVADLVLGMPDGRRATTCLVQVRTGEPRSEHRAELGRLALLETLRTGCPPCRTATYYAATGALDLEEVTDATLTAAVADAFAGIGRRVPDVPAAPDLSQRRSAPGGPDAPASAAEPSRRAA